MASDCFRLPGPLEGEVMAFGEEEDGGWYIIDDPEDPD